MFQRRFTLAAAAAGAVALALTACSGPAPTSAPTSSGSTASSTAPQEYNDIVFWTPHTVPERVAIQEKVAADFEAKTGIHVEVVPMAGPDQNQALVTGAASGDVPDVILHAPDQTASWREQGLLDTALAGQIVDGLGRDTFNQHALSLISLNGEVGAVPTDGWIHVIAYRKDLFDAAGVSVPKSLVELADAAEALAAKGVSGIAMGTQPGTPSSTEAVESTFLSTGCQLLDGKQVVIDSAECTAAAEQFKRLAESSLAGEFDVPSARSAYLAGTASMLVFSTHILDEVAGLDPANNPLTCAECAADPMFLAKNTGFITVLDPAHPAKYGTTLNYGIPVGAHSTEAKLWVEYLLSDGYIETLGMATEGRLPVRAGTAQEPTKFLDEWGQLPFGTDRTQNLSIADVYGPEIVAELGTGMDAVTRWGFGTDQAPVAGAVFAQNVLSQNLTDLYGGTPAAEVTAAMAEQVKAIQTELGLN